MRSRRSANENVAEVARRRLEAWSAELGHSESAPAADGFSDVDGGGTAGSPARDAARPLPGRHAHRSLGTGETITGWVHDRLPATLQGRVAMTGAHLAVLALVVMAALALTVWWVSRASGHETAVAPVAVGSASALVSVSASATPSTDSAAPTTAGGSASVAGSPGGSIVVDVAGKVRRPGIATLPQGSRVVDALEAAGGVRRGARLHGLNLARVLTDGEQLLVGVSAPPGVAASAAAAPTSGSGTPMVDINTATEAQLEELPGVGPVTAQAILDYRSENGAFTAVDQLLEVSGIGDATLADLAPYVTL